GCAETSNSGRPRRPYTPSQNRSRPRLRHKTARKSCHSLFPPPHPPVSHRYILPPDKTRLTETSAKCLDQVSSILGRPGAQIADHRHLRADRERPCCHACRNQLKKLSPFHHFDAFAPTPITNSN